MSVTSRCLLPRRQSFIITIIIFDGLVDLDIVLGLGNDRFILPVSFLASASCSDANRSACNGSGAASAVGTGAARAAQPRQRGGAMRG